MADVFISYARSTERQAGQIADALRGLGYSVWRDDELPAHRPYAEVIQERLAAAKAVVVVWSAEAAKSEWVQSEADRARGDHKLVQLTVDGAALPMPFDRIQCADLSGWAGDTDAPGWKKAIASVGDLIGREPGSFALSAVAAHANSTRSIPQPHSGASAVSGRRWSSRVWVLTAVVVLTVTAGGAAWLIRSSAPAPAPMIRVAVAPFEAAGRGQDSAMLARSLSDSISDALSANQVALLPRDDALTLRGAGSAATIERLGVGLVLDGAVRSDGKTFDVRVHLDDPRSHVTLWSKSYDGPVKDAEALRTRVGGHATNVISLAVSPGVASIRGNPELLAAYLEAADESDGGGGRALAIYRDLVARAPNFSGAHSLLATGLVAQFNVPGPAQPDVLAEAAKEAKRALELDPANGEAYFALSLTKPYLAWSEQEELLRKGLAEEPNSADLHAAYSQFLRFVGRSREAVSHARQAVAAAPFKERPRRFLAVALTNAGLTDEASATADEARRLWPDNPKELFSQIMVAASSSPPSRKLLTYREDPLLETLGPPALVDLVGRSFEATVSTDAAKRRAMAAAISRVAASGEFPAGIAMNALTNLGDADGAFALADRFATPENLRRPVWSAPIDTSFIFAPAVASLRKDRRFMPLVARLGLIDYWRASGHWPDFCSEPGLPYDCKTEAARLAGNRPS